MSAGERNRSHPASAQPEPAPITAALGSREIRPKLNAPRCRTSEHLPIATGATGHRPPTKRESKALPRKSLTTANENDKTRHKTAPIQGPENGTPFGAAVKVFNEGDPISGSRMQPRKQGHQNATILFRFQSFRQPKMPVRHPTIATSRRPRALRPVKPFGLRVATVLPANCRQAPYTSLPVQEEHCYIKCCTAWAKASAPSRHSQAT